MRSCRVTRDWRLIYEPEADAGLRLLHIGKHDVAYRKGGWQRLLANDTEAAFADEDWREFEMFQPRSRDPVSIDQDEELIAILRDAELMGLAEAIGGVVRQTIDLSDGEAAPSVLFHDQQGNDLPINLIPAIGGTATCQPLLLAFCFDADSFTKRLTEVSNHAGIICAQTRVVVLVTTQWNPKVWRSNHRQVFEALKAVVLVYFAAPDGDTVRIL